MNAMEGSQSVTVNGMNSLVDDDKDPTDFNHVITTNGHAGKHISKLSSWHSCSVEKHDRQKLLDQKGCVVWITGLSGSGKSTMASALSRILHQRGKLSYILDGDNIRHSLNKDLGFEAEDRAENIRRVGEVAKAVCRCWSYLHCKLSFSL